MEDMHFKIHITKVIDMCITEERGKIRKHYSDTLGKQTADYMDSYQPSQSDVLKLFGIIHDAAEQGKAIATI